MVTKLVRSNFGLGFVLNLDLKSLNDCYASVVDSEDDEHEEAAITAMIAAQGEWKSMKSWIKKRWRKKEDRKGTRPKRDGDALRKRFGKGV